MRLIPLEDVQPGMRLARPVVRDRQGRSVRPPPRKVDLALRPDLRVVGQHL